MNKALPLAKTFEQYQINLEACNHQTLDIAIVSDVATKQFSMLVDENDDLSKILAERITKSLLWMVGGIKLYLAGPAKITTWLSECFTTTGIRAFDVQFMETVFKRPFKVIVTTKDDLPNDSYQSSIIGGFTEGARIGLDVGGSDLKVTCLLDNRLVFQKEQVWEPKLHGDYQYHYQAISDLLTEARSKLPKVDSLGVSTAGVCLNNEICISSLFRKIPDKDYEQYIRTIYQQIASNMGIARVAVANDGDVTALAAVLDYKICNTLGIAMGTSEAGGYVDANKHLTGWFNELAFVPFMLGEGLPVDEWSGEVGAGANLLSQEAVWLFATDHLRALRNGATLAEFLEIVLNELTHDNADAAKVFKHIGEMLAHAIAYYHYFYHFVNVIVLGRVASGRAGEIIKESANTVLKQEYPNLKITIIIPENVKRRLGQSYAAATLPNNAYERSSMYI